MSVAFNAGSVVATPGQQIAFSSLFSVSPASNPTYLLVSGLDRNEYTVTSNGNMGTLSGNGHAVGFTSSTGDSSGSDFSSIGVLFTYNAATGQYVNSTYGNLNSLVYTASTDKNRNATISLYGSNDASVLTQNQNDPIGLLEYAGSSYLGTVDVVTQPSYGPAPAQATPNGIAAIAQTFVGQAWNSSGCWVLACNIASEAGASLPVISSVSGAGGQANGEWMVAFDGSNGGTGDWQSTLRTGDIVVFTTSGGTGHITTIAAGSGYSAQVIDNATFGSSSGGIANAANDGSPKDIIIQGPHSASAEFMGVSASSVVVYRLDTPVVTAATAAISMKAGQSVSLAGLISAADPAGKAVTVYQLYDTTAQDTMVVGGSATTASSAASAVTVSASALATTSVRAGSGVGNIVSGTLMVRAFNGKYWGDWAAVKVAVTPSSISMTTSYVLSNLDVLKAAVAAGNLGSITLTDAGKPGLTLSAADYATYKPVIDKISGPYVLSVTGNGLAATITGSNGTNLFSAGQAGGNHLLQAGASTNGHDTIMGGVGSDTLTGSTSTGGAAVLVAGAGTNTVQGGLGADTLYGGGRSTLTAGAGYQMLLGGYSAAARDTLTAASAGHDFLAVANGRNVLNAGSGVGSVLVGGVGGDRLNGSTVATGSAILVGGSGAESLYGGLGADTLVGGGASALYAGTASASQVLLAGFSTAAHDTLSAGSNNAVMAVALGRNTLQAGTGHATLFGGGGADYLIGQGGASVMVAGSGQNTLQGGAGSDTMIGGGQSLLIGGAGTSGASVMLAGYSASAHDTLKAGTGSGETLAVMRGNNTLYADQTGKGTNDTLIAGLGNDTLYGSSGSTTFSVGGGNTSVYGGTGNDTVLVRSSQGHLTFDGGAGTNTVTLATESEAHASIVTASSGVTTITFDNSSHVLTLAHVSSVAFSGSNTTHALAA